MNQVGKANATLSVISINTLRPSPASSSSSDSLTIGLAVVNMTFRFIQAYWITFFFSFRDCLLAFLYCAY